MVDKFIIYLNGLRARTILEVSEAISENNRKKTQYKRDKVKMIDEIKEKYFEVQK